MRIPENLKFYAKKLGYPSSPILAEILIGLFNTELKQKLAGFLPETLEGLSEQSGVSRDEVETAIGELRKVGAVCRNHRKKEVTEFDLYPDMIEIRDAVLLSHQVDQHMVEMWDHMVRREMPKTIPLMKKLAIPPAMRTIPIEETVESGSVVLDIESARSLVLNADQIVAVPCVCRSSRHQLNLSPDCPAPETPDLCFLINRFGSEALERGVGKIISREEALRRLKIAEDAGLVHMTRNNIKKDLSICNCCSCCCTGTFLHNQFGYNAFTPSRFRVELDTDECTGCETCIDRCQFLAIIVDEVAIIDLDKCFGCGNCVQTCPSEALTLVAFLDENSIRKT
ncbi:MAG: 4Fe-4S binding protein [Deltaproteobacteria bacterium]|jgi:NAD-dependent dihydropyrimidine dehydrogenase PreA subunit|nr:4Fe-4S binding protein [Deltaproteobacteria bacterium]MBT4262865.1 4Fe-4S binding protein [Deltaproteobacteria bacterium]MBT4640928.1 4Fe-4S binding protein [Deltaproteobacteria bacterium]MBT6500442.1 4Fe-4S binding protein [Deltaproteobacteria bacterium]MBT7153431.1 4Fe-4S binding protein [Deltaproteobacteria bacterium]